MYHDHDTMVQGLLLLGNQWVLADLALACRAMAVMISIIWQDGLGLAVQTNVNLYS